MDQLIKRCAGLDVGKKTVAATVRVPGKGSRRHKQTRRFATTTGSILALRDWLAEHAVTVVGMESTGAYWKPIYPDINTGYPLDAITAPTLICHGRDDPGPPYHGAVTLTRQIPGATLVSWDQGGHIGLGDHPHIDAAIHTLLHNTATPTDELRCF